MPVCAWIRASPSLPSSSLSCIRHPFTADCLSSPQHEQPTSITEPFARNTGPQVLKLHQRSAAAIKHSWLEKRTACVTCKVGRYCTTVHCVVTFIIMRSLYKPTRTVTWYRMIEYVMCSAASTVHSSQSHAVPNCIISITKLPVCLRTTYCKLPILPLTSKPYR